MDMKSYLFFKETIKLIQYEQGCWMNMVLNKNISSIIFVVASCFGYAGFANADDGGATMDPEGVSATFTGFAIVTCSFKDGIPTDYLTASIRDLSPPVDGLMVNLQLLKIDKGMAVSIADTVSGDSKFSDPIQLRGGNGVYYMMVNKTDVGARTFDISYHCMSDTGLHTDTSIGVLQFQ